MHERIVNLFAVRCEAFYLLANEGFEAPSVRCQRFAEEKPSILPRLNEYCERDDNMALKCFQDIRFFVFSLCLLVLTDVLSSVYYRSTLTTLERRFELSATKAALLSTAYHLGNLVVIPFVSFYGSKTHRPRLIAAGAVLASFGYLVCSLPQFFGGRYQYVDTTTNNSALFSQRIQMCDSTTDPLPMTTECQETEISRDNNLYIVIVLGLILSGIGGAPVQPLGVSYIDDYSPSKKSPVYIGTAMTLGHIAPAFGFLLGAAILRIWVDVGWIDISEIKILPTHPSWIGAWWIGFFLTAILVGVSSIPLFFFPKNLKSAKRERNELELNPGIDVNKENERLKVSANKEKGFFQALRSLFTNAAFLLVIMMWIFSAYSVVGEVTFFPKFLEVQFGFSASKANMYYGAISIPCLAVGTMLGSYLVIRLRLDRLGMIKFILGARFSCILVAVSFLFLGCETIDIAGLTKPYADNADTYVLGTVSSCNSGCGCTNGTFNPVCGADDITYISPCHAGCRGVGAEEEEFIQNYTDCNCIRSQSTNAEDRWSQPERCERSKCGHLVGWVLAAKALFSFLQGATNTPTYLYLIRSVGMKEKAFAIGVEVMIVRLLGWIPGPIIYGKAIDSTCIYWASSPCLEKGYCRVYDTNNFRTVFFSVVVGAEALSCLVSAVLYFLTRRQKSSDSGNSGCAAETRGREKDIVQHQHQTKSANKDCEVDSTQSKITKVSSENRKAKKILPSTETQL